MERLFLILLMVGTSFGEIIPAERRWDWEGNVGVSGGIPRYTNISARIFPSGSAATDTARVMAELAAAADQSVVFLETGRFLFNSPIDFQVVGTNRVVLRGNGPKRTKATFSSGAYISLRSDYCEPCLTNSVNLSATATRGSTNISLASVPSWLIAGNTYLIDQLDDEVYASAEFGEDLNAYRNTIGYGVSKIGEFNSDITGWVLASGSAVGSSVAYQAPPDAFASVSSGSLKLAGNFSPGTAQAGTTYVFPTPVNIEDEYTRISFWAKVVGGDSTVSSNSNYGNITAVLRNGAGLTTVPLEVFTLRTEDASAWRQFNLQVQGTNGLSDVRELEIRISATNYAGPVSVLVDQVYLVAHRAANHMIKVTAKTSTNITIELPLTWDWTTNLKAQVSMAGYNPVSSYQIKRCGVEDMWIEADYQETAINFIKFENADECWIDNIASYNQPGRSHFISFWGYRCEVRDSFFWDSHAWGGGQGYGVNLFTGTFACLVENNILRKTHVGVTPNYGASGNVIAYNYIFDSFADANQAPSIVTHGAHAMYNLIEGNICEDKIMGDFVHGSASHNTVFRNRVDGTSFTGVFDQTAVSIEKWNRAWNIVGNALGTTIHTNYSLGAYTNDIISLVDNDGLCSDEIKTIYKFGFPRNYACSWLIDDQISDTPELLDLIIHGNWDTVSNLVWSASIADHALPDSYYLSGQPDWWDASVPWPPVEPTTMTTNGLSAITIPAKLRYEAMWVPPTYRTVHPRGSVMPGSSKRSYF